MTETDQQYGSLMITKSTIGKGVFYSLNYFTDGEELPDLSDNEEEVYIVRNVNAIEYEVKIVHLCKLASDGKMDDGAKISEDELKDSLGKLLIKQGVEA